MRCAESAKMPSSGVARPPVAAHTATGRRRPPGPCAARSARPLPPAARRRSRARGGALQHVEVSGALGQRLGQRAAPRTRQRRRRGRAPGATGCARARSARSPRAVGAREHRRGRAQRLPPGASTRRRRRRAGGRAAARVLDMPTCQGRSSCAASGAQLAPPSRLARGRRRPSSASRLGHTARRQRTAAPPPSPASAIDAVGGAPQRQLAQAPAGLTREEICSWRAPACEVDRPCPGADAEQFVGGRSTTTTCRPVEMRSGTGLAHRHAGDAAGRCR